PERERRVLLRLGRARDRDVSVEHLDAAPELDGRHRLVAATLRAAAPAGAHHPELNELVPRTARRPPRRGGDDFADAVARPGGPADPVEIAQRTGAVLHVGLEQVEGATEAIAG